MVGCQRGPKTGMMSVNNSTLDKLRQFDTPTVCNVIELFGVRPRNQGYMDHRVRCAFPDLPPMVGFAATAGFRAAGAPSGVDAYGSTDAQLEAFEQIDGPPVVVFQDLDDPQVAAVFGEVMCTTYRAFGSVGLVTNGGGRDLDQVRALDYPVFIGSILSSHAYCHTLHVGLPVTIGGLVVQQGDLLHGDRNGVTSLPVAIAAEVADVAGEFVAAEDIVLDYLKGPETKSRKRLAEVTAELGSVIADLRARVARTDIGKTRY